MRAPSTFLALGALLGACSADPAPASDAGPAGGPIDATIRLWCATAADGGARVVQIDPGACQAVAGADAGVSSEAELGATQYGQEGEDDDCKYHLTFSTSPVHRNENVTLTVTVTALFDGSPVTAADPMAEIFLSDVHPAPNSDAVTTEGSGGTYTIAPVRFDAPGDWTVRFHLHHTCADTEESPHGHGAFFVRVP